MDSAAPNVIVNPERFELAIHANEDCTFELTNVGYEAVIYRVRTTAPLRYYLKHSKGVVRGNSSAKVTIFLNRKNFAEGAEPGQRFTKDTFRVECAVLGEQDVVEAHCANIANLIQKKKDVNPAAVVQKHVYCRVMMEPETAPGDSATAVSANAAGRISAAHNASERSDAAGGSAAGADAGAEGGGSRKNMTVHEVVENTLKEKHRRSDGGQTVVRGGHTALIRIGIASALVLVFAIWMMSGSVGEVAEDIAA